MKYIVHWTELEQGYILGNYYDCFDTEDEAIAEVKQLRNMGTHHIQDIFIEEEDDE